MKPDNQLGFMEDSQLEVSTLVWDLRIKSRWNNKSPK
jgi:hypothetical protein